MRGPEHLLCRANLPLKFEVAAEAAAELPAVNGLLRAAYSRLHFLAADSQTVSFQDLFGQACPKLGQHPLGLPWVEVHFRVSSALPETFPKCFAEMLV
jgi:hypothetical protein